MPAGLWIAVPAAMCAALSFGFSSNLQYRASHQVPVRGPANPTLFADLVRNRLFEYSIGLNLLGFGLQVTALRFGPVMLVQPLLVTSLLFYVLLTPALNRHRPDAVRIAGASLTLAGLIAFLLVARPADVGGRDLTPDTILPLAIGLAVLLTACIAGSHTVAREWRSLPLAMATGICYGVTAGLVRSLSNRFTDGFPELLFHWQLYAICVLGPLGVLLNQNTFQAGKLGSPALAIITTVDPLISIGVGLLWLDGTIAVGPAPIFGEIIALAVMAAGIGILATRAPHLSHPPRPRAAASDRAERRRA
ncbi:MAG: DMT family transporter [Micromonosporaceae bacterium]|nr:DMT family transporter [Micromonosporaceae bacterium]